MREIWQSTVEVWSWLMQHLWFINVLLSIVIVFFQRRDPKTVWTWLLAIYFIPVFGVAFYLLFGQDMKKSRMFRVKEADDRLKFPIKSQEAVIRSERREDHHPDAMTREYSSLVLYNLETSGAVLTSDNSVDIYTDGREKFEALRQALRGARRFIHIQYYIIKNDEVFDSIVPILIEKVKEGVEVRILYDGMGGRFMPKRRWEEMRLAGIRVGTFFPPFLGWLNLRVNYRNHRKIVVIDGTTGFVGGFNIGREYISKDPQFGYWRDTHLKIKGEAAISLQIRFALDWNYATGENLFKDLSYLGDEAEAARKRLMGEGNGHIWPKDQADAEQVYMQIITSGPDTREPHIRNNYLELFHKAKRHIYIQTPYFIPDDAILSALKIAASSGVDVRLMIPCKPDHPFVYWATCSYAGELLDYGARCYVYENGFLHSKGVMVDGQVSCYGTANMDIRSFELNFEVNATIYDQKTTERLEKAFMDDLPHCREITREDYHSRRLWMRLKEQMCRLLSPLL